MSKSLQKIKPLVSINWLYQHLDAANLVVLNGTLTKVTLEKNEIKTTDFQVKNARFFDLKKVFSVQDAPFPNTVLKPSNFQEKARELGINNNSCIVIYDEYGIYSSARVWWLFKTMGFENVAVLDGGFPAWKKANYPTEKKQENIYEKGNFIVVYQSEKIINADVVLQSISDEKTQIIDARSSGRFSATEPEPRKEVRSGHIPTSKSLPYSSLLNGEFLKPKQELIKDFQKVNPDNKELIFSCGSGITACVLALGATIAGHKSISVYDGSWTEWGSLQDLPIEK